MIRLNGEHMREKLAKLIREHQEEERRKKRRQVRKNGKVS